MSEKEQSLGTDSISGIILDASNRERERLAYLEESVAAAKRLEAEAEQRAIEAEREKEEALRSSFEDPLTECLNRRYFIKYMEENFDPIRDDGNVALIFVDMDGLKQVNDNDGHDEGDKVLKLMANCLKSGSRRSGNTVVRLGGDEFVIISKNLPGDNGQRSPVGPEIESESATSFEESLEIMMDRIALDAKKKDPRLAFSYGIGVYDMVLDEEPPDGPVESVEVRSLGDVSKLNNTLIRADTNMYAHKKEIS